MLTTDEVLRRAGTDAAGFAARVRDVPYERKGVLYSEMFFLWLCANAAGPPRRILESGRARGQSTLLLALAFPDLPIISIEHDPGSPDVAVAAQRLAGRRNVELRFGDATRLLPQLAEPGDIALIDGPKGFRALRLAMQLLAQGRTTMVFLHDMLRGTPERRFLDRRMPSALYADEPRFAECARPLDARVQEEIPPGGYGLTCLQRDPRIGYRRVWWHAVLAGLQRDRD
jgi:predicted O-methyltransferase YrrM